VAVEAAALDAAPPVLPDTPDGGDIRARIDVRAWLRIGVVAAVPLLGLLICMAATRTNVLVPQADRPVPSWMAGPLRYVGFDTPTGVAIGMMLLLFAAYVVAVVVAERVPPRTVLIAVIAFNVIVLLGPPLFSTDVFSYQMYARLFASYHLNPYTHGPSAASLDSLYPYIGAKWISTPSVYGPLFTLASAALAGASITASEFVFKLVAALASCGTLFLIWRCARLRNLNPTRAIALFGLNPLVTLYGVGGGHNDLLMLLFTTASIYALLSRRNVVGGASIIISAATKLTGGVLLPFAMADRTHPDDMGRRHRNILLGAAAAAIVIAIPSFLLFGGGLFKLPSTLRDVQSQGIWQSVPGFFLNLTGNSESHTITSVLGLIFAGVCLWLLWRVWHGRMDWLEGAGWATFMMLVTAGSLLPWYVSWLLPLVGLTSSRRLWRASLWMTGVATLMTVTTYLSNGIPLLKIF
jgi:alpha-1,6-mannosyltransferase